MKYPQDFTDSLQGLPGLDDPGLLLEALGTPSPVCVRFNPFKLGERPEGRQVPWSRYGYLLEERPVFTLDPVFHGGAYYVQEPGSMFIEHLFRSAFPEDRRLRILDACAAPGGKTTLLSTLAGLESTVIANEVIRPRAFALSDNIKKWGLGNVAVTNNDPSHFNDIKDYFDMVLVDAPCSGEGMFRKDPEAVGHWTRSNVELCSQRQRRILADIWNSLRPGGVLIYSTCTFNRAENEDNIDWLASEYEYEKVEVETDPSWGVVKGETSGIQTFRFYPHKAESEGFFAAILRKGDRKQRTKLPRASRQPISATPRKQAAVLGQWVEQPEFMEFANIGENSYGFYSASYGDIGELAGVLNMIYSGVMLGQSFNGKLKPDHPLALFHDLNRNIVPGAELSLNDALEYLRKQAVDPELFTEGLNLVEFSGLPIGWVKRIGNRANNMYPKELRIQHL